MACCSLSGRIATLIASFLILVFYMMLGAIMFQAIELPHELKSHNESRVQLEKDNKSASPAVQSLTYKFNSSACLALEALAYFKIENKSEPTEEFSWTYTKSLMFAFSVITTLGYGDLIPSTHIGKGMTMLFGITTIPIYFMMVMLYSRHSLSLLNGMIDRITSDIRHAAKIRHGVLVGLLSVAYLLFATVFSVKNHYNFGDAMWFTFATFTTLGFGDFYPTHEAVHAFYFVIYVTIVYIIIGMMLLTWKEAFFELHAALAKYSSSICGICCTVSIHHGALRAEPGMSRLQEEPVDAEMEAVEFDPNEEEGADTAGVFAEKV